MIGLDIGGTKCAVSLGEMQGDKLNIVDKKIIPTELNVSPYKMIDKMIDLAKSMTDNIDVIGISCGGPLNSKDGIIMSPPNLLGWDNVEINKYIKEKTGAVVFLENDANACTLAEWKYGAGKGCDNMIFLTFGTGLGAGMILNGKLYRGACDMAGEVGHIRLNNYGPVGYGKMGSFEGFCSGNGIAQLGKSYALEKLQLGKSVSFCKTISDIENITAKKIAECALSGFEDAISVYFKCGEMLGLGLSILVDILNPQKIVIGSIYQRCEVLLCESMQSVLKKECISYSLDACRIVPAKLGDDIGDWAALTVAALGKGIV